MRLSSTGGWLDAGWGLARLGGLWLLDPARFRLSGVLAPGSESRCWDLTADAVVASPAFLRWGGLGEGWGLSPAPAGDMAPNLGGASILAPAGLLPSLGLRVNSAGGGGRGKNTPFAARLVASCFSQQKLDPLRFFLVRGLFIKRFRMDS